MGVASTKDKGPSEIRRATEKGFKDDEKNSKMGIPKNVEDPTNVLFWGWKGEGT